MSEKPPLFVDLDGTLVRTDTTAAGILALIGRPLRLVSGLFALRFGKAAMKQRIAAAAPLDPALLPYNEELLSLLRREAAAGRSLVLATGADRRVAAAVADHLGLFAAVLASDGAVNLTGRAKLDAIRRMIGDRPFAYAGNERKDLAIWREAESAILVDVSRRLFRAASATTRIEVSFAAKSDRTAALARARAAFRVGAAARRAGIGRGRTAMSVSGCRRSARRDR
jgi:haloacid dehalogenase-like hydrolase